MATRYGKYRGTVVDNVDPMMIGRLLVTVPAVDLSGVWAMPCFPMAGQQTGAWLMPGPGSGVWVEFEEGDVDYPIWSGCWYGSADQVPSFAREASPATPPILLQTPGQTCLRLSDAPGRAGGALLQTPSGGHISITDEGIMLSNGKGATITLVGPTVSVNEGALEVT